jgi:hypothetical protein
MKEKAVGFLDTHKPVKVSLKRAMRSAASPEKRLRKIVVKNIEAQLQLLKNPDLKTEGGRRRGSWFQQADGAEYFMPKQSGQNVAEWVSKKKANSFPVMKDRRTTLLAFKEGIEAGEFDPTLVAISNRRSALRQGRRRGPKKATGRRAKSAS